MGQQQTMRATGTALRRILLVLAVAALTAAMLVVMAVPAFAYANHDTGSGSGDGQEQAQNKNQATLGKQLENGVTAGGGPKEGISAPTNSDHYFQLSGLIGKP